MKRTKHQWSHKTKKEESVTTLGMSLRYNEPVGKSFPLSIFFFYYNEMTLVLNILSKHGSFVRSDFYLCLDVIYTLSTNCCLIYTIFLQFLVLFSVISLVISWSPNKWSFREWTITTLRWQRSFIFEFCFSQAFCCKQR